MFRHPDGRKDQTKAWESIEEPPGPLPPEANLRVLGPPARAEAGQENQLRTTASKPRLGQALGGKRAVWGSLESHTSGDLEKDVLECSFFLDLLLPLPSCFTLGS